MTTQENSDESVNQREGSISQNTKVDITQGTLSLIFSVAALCLALFSGTIAWWEGRQMQQVQIQLMYMNAIALREGLVQPGDMVYGPEGNLEYKQHELKRK
jgi:hypothetical protein